MLCLQKPNDRTIRQFLDRQASCELTYDAIGATENQPPSGFVVDRTRIRLGEGRETFDLAVQALRQWKHLNFRWLVAVPSAASMKTGQDVAIIAHVAGLWWVNACRSVLVVNDSGPVARFGFAYGTLPDHVECGEERFLVEWDRSDNSVWYDILAFSRPRHNLARAAYPFARATQKAFGQASCEAMRRAVSFDETAPQSTTRMLQVERY